MVERVKSVIDHIHAGIDWLASQQGTDHPVGLIPLTEGVGSGKTYATKYQYIDTEGNNDISLPMRQRRKFIWITATKNLLPNVHAKEKPFPQIWQNNKRVKTLYPPIVFIDGVEHRFAVMKQEEKPISGSRGKSRMTNSGHFAFDSAEFKDALEKFLKDSLRVENDELEQLNQALSKLNDWTNKVQKNKFDPSYLDYAKKKFVPAYGNVKYLLTEMFRKHRKDWQDDVFIDACHNKYDFVKATNCFLEVVGRSNGKINKVAVKGLKQLFPELFIVNAQVVELTAQKLWSRGSTIFGTYYYMLDLINDCVEDDVVNPLIIDEISLVKSQEGDALIAQNLDSSLMAKKQSNEVDFVDLLDIAQFMYRHLVDNSDVVLRHYVKSEQLTKEQVEVLKPLLDGEQNDYPVEEHLMALVDFMKKYHLNKTFVLSVDLREELRKKANQMFVTSPIEDLLANNDESNALVGHFDGSLIECSVQDIKKNPLVVDKETGDYLNDFPVFEIMRQLQFYVLDAWHAIYNLFDKADVVMDTKRILSVLFSNPTNTMLDFFKNNEPNLQSGTRIVQTVNDNADLDEFYFDSQGLAINRSFESPISDKLKFEWLNLSNTTEGLLYDACCTNLVLGLSADFDLPTVLDHFNKDWLENQLDQKNYYYDLRRENLDLLNEIQDNIDQSTQNHRNHGLKVDVNSIVDPGKIVKNSKNITFKQLLGYYDWPMHFDEIILKDQKLYDLVWDWLLPKSVSETAHPYNENLTLLANGETDHGHLWVQFELLYVVIQAVNQYRLDPNYRSLMMFTNYGMGDNSHSITANALRDGSAEKKFNEYLDGGSKHNNRIGYLEALLRGFVEEFNKNYPDERQLIWPEINQETHMNLYGDAYYQCHERGRLVDSVLADDYKESDRIYIELTKKQNGKLAWKREHLETSTYYDKVILGSLSDGAFKIVIVSYQTASTGQNPIYGIPDDVKPTTFMIRSDDDKRHPKKDFDMLYLAKPTHVRPLAKFTDQKKHKDHDDELYNLLLKTARQLAELYISHELSPKGYENNIKTLLNTFHDCGYYIYQVPTDPKERAQYNVQVDWTMTKIIDQAVGRIIRTGNRLNQRIWIDSDALASLKYGKYNDDHYGITFRSLNSVQQALLDCQQMSNVGMISFQNQTVHSIIENNRLAVCCENLIKRALKTASDDDKWSKSEYKLGILQYMKGYQRMHQLWIKYGLILTDDEHRALMDEISKDSYLVKFTKGNSRKYSIVDGGYIHTDNPTDCYYIKHGVDRDKLVDFSFEMKSGLSRRDLKSGLVYNILMKLNQEHSFVIDELNQSDRVDLDLLSDKQGTWLLMPGLIDQYYGHLNEEIMKIVLNNFDPELKLSELNETKFNLTRWYEVFDGVDQYFDPKSAVLYDLKSYNSYLNSWYKPEHQNSEKLIDGKLKIKLENLTQKANLNIKRVVYWDLDTETDDLHELRIKREHPYRGLKVPYENVEVDFIPSVMFNSHGDEYRKRLSQFVEEMIGEENGTN